jgi:HlyD family secretion protein
VVLVLWAFLGKLDIIASAEGRLVPQTYVKIVQPADAGIVQEILVREGQSVAAGQVLLRMDTHDAQADERTLQAALQAKSLKVRRVDAELSGSAMRMKSGDPDDLFRQVQTQYENNRRLHDDETSKARETVHKAQRDYDAGVAVLAKLREIVPLLKQEADSYADLGKDGYVPRSTQQEKQREYLEKLHDLDAQQPIVDSLAAAVAQASRELDQVTSKYRSELQNERVEAQGDVLRLQQEEAKQTHKSGLLELRAPQAGIVKDLATHTIGTVVSPGTVVLSLVPENEPLVAEVMVHNDDVGFVYEQQDVKLKLVAYPFQKYGMLEGKVIRVSPDAMSEEAPTSRGREVAESSDGRSGGSTTQNYKAIVVLDKQYLEAKGQKFKLVPGMQVVAEINQGRRTVMEYLLSPITATIHDSARER